MKRYLGFLFAVFLLLLASGVKAEEPDHHLTLMLYLCGSNLESEKGLASADLEEIKDACSGNPSVTVLVMVGGSLKWSENRFDSSQTTILEIGASGADVLESFPAYNMGDAETLSFFLRYASEKRPASQYALIFWDHGGGPMEGVCLDERSETDWLELSEISTALRNSPFSPENRLSWIGFDACLMASVETALCCKDYADYMIASQETEPNSGWNYRFLRDVHHESKAEDVCRSIVKGYTEEKKGNDILTLSLIDLSEIDPLIAAMNQFFSDTNLLLTPRTFSGISRIRRDTRCFGWILTGSEYDLIDLFDLTDQFVQSEYADLSSVRSARSVQTAVLRAVKQTTGNQEFAHGLSLYYPYDNREKFSGGWFREYRQWEDLSDYADYLTKFDSFWNGEQMAEWRSLRGNALPLTGEGTQALELLLTDDQAEHFASASCMILEDAGSENSYINTYLIEDISLEGNKLTAEYSFDALYAVDDNGVRETDAIPFVEKDGNYLIYATLQKQSILNYHTKDRTRYDEESLDIMLQCKRENDELIIQNIIPLTNRNDGLIMGRMTIQPDPETWPFIRFSGTAREIAADPEGSILPFDEWTGLSDSVLINYDAVGPDGTQLSLYNWHAIFGDVLPADYHATTEADNTRQWRLRFCKRKATGRELAAQFVVRDTQGYFWGSDLVPLQNPDVSSQASVICSPLEISGATIQPYMVKTIINDTFQGICIRFKVRSGSDSTTNLIMINPIINGITTENDYLAASRSAEAEEECIEDIYIGLSHMPFRDDPVIRTISCILDIPGSDHPLGAFSERAVLETSLDVSALPLRDRPAEAPLDSVTEEDIEIQLISLEESEDSLLRGEIHLVNKGPVRRWIYINQFRDDPLPVFYINGCTARNCTKTDQWTLLLPGGERYLDFKTGDPGQDLRVLGNGTEKWATAFSEIDDCGFSVMLINEDSLIIQDDGTLAFKTSFVERDGKVYMVEGGMSYLYRFRLPESLALNRTIRLVYTPENSETR